MADSREDDLLSRHVPLPGGGLLDLDALPDDDTAVTAAMLRACAERVTALQRRSAAAAVPELTPDDFEMLVVDAASMEAAIAPYFDGDDEVLLAACGEHSVLCPRVWTYAQYKRER